MGFLRDKKGYVGVIVGLHRGYTGIMQRKMETTI